MKTVTKHGESPSANPKDFQCYSCGCQYTSNERYERFGMIQDVCPECNSDNVKEI